MRFYTVILCCLVALTTTFTQAQFRFEGQLGPDWTEGTVYLSLIEDYRKIRGVYPEQVLARITPDSLGQFVFEGDFLPLENRIYRIHVDLCAEEQTDEQHFLGHCLNSREVIFLANNKDRLALPTGFEEQLFCEIVSTNRAAGALMRVDSVMQELAYDIGPNPSRAAQNLKTEKWLSDLQKTAESNREPLAELYAYGIFSDRAGSLRSTYLADLDTSSYYDALLSRLETQYPETEFTEQYRRELEQDRAGLTNTSSETWPTWMYVIIGICLISLFMNMQYLRQIKQLKDRQGGAPSLSPQEQKVLDLIKQDRTNKEIAQELFVSVSTVKTHINNLYKKLGVQSREEVKSL